MRYLNQNNKKSFIAFAVVISFILGVFSIFIVKNLKNKSATYAISAGSVVYDKDENYIKTEAEGTIKKLWNGEYKLRSNNEEYDLGKQSIVYEPASKNIISYGNIYKVVEDASVTVEDVFNEITTSSGAAFYKLADRKYLIVADEIEVPAQNLKLENYLIINIDKSGTCKIYNDKVNLKILEAIKINFAGNTFDVANETLESEKELIALAKIGGTTNEYTENLQDQVKEDSDSNKNEPEQDTLDGITLNDGSEGSGGAGSITNNSTSTTNNSSNITANGQWNFMPSELASVLTSMANSINKVNDKVTTGETNNTGTNSPGTKLSTLRINYITTGFNELTVNYSILDYENKYSAVYLILESSHGESQTIILNTEENSRTIHGLQPDTSYTISIGATIGKLVNGVEENEDVIVDTSKTHTDSVNALLTVEKLTSKALAFNFKIKNGLSLESGKVVLYGDGNKLDEKDIVGDSVITNQGWSSSFNLEDFSDVKEFTLKVEDTVYNGEKLIINEEITIQNTLFGSFRVRFKSLLNNIF